MVEVVLEVLVVPFLRAGDVEVAQQLPEVGGEVEPELPTVAG